MKYLFVLLISILLFSNCSKKTSPVVKVMTSEIKIAQVAVLHSKKMNVIFRGVVNPFEVEVPGISQDSIEVSIDQGKIRHLWRSNKYEIIPDTIGPLNIFVSWKENQITQRDSFFYRVKYCPDPIPYLSGNFSNFATPDSVTVDKIKSLYSVGTLLKGFDFDAKCRIFGAEILRIQPNGKRTTFDLKAPRFSKQGKDFLKTAEAGDIFIFRQLICRCPGDEKDSFRKLLNFSVEIY